MDDEAMADAYNEQIVGLTRDCWVAFQAGAAFGAHSEREACARLVRSQELPSDPRCVDAEAYAAYLAARILERSNVLLSGG